MAGEDIEIPIALEKLEISPMLPHIKLLDQNNLPVTLNPFYDETINVNSSNSIFKDVHKAKCSCRMRRRSESVVDKLKGTTTHSKSPSRNYQYEHSIRNCNQFKKVTSSSNFILREPVLKAFQRCLLPHSSIRRQSLSSAVSSDIQSNVEDCKTIEALNLKDDNELDHKLSQNTKLESKDESKNKKEMTNFRQLIEECQTLLETNVSFSSDLNCKNSETFSTIQLQNSRIPQESSNSNSRKILLSHNLMQNRGKQLSVSNPSTSTCSQQARINASSGEPMQQASPSSPSSSCDVTIDELASYFETLVHIPKKMSTMAEMMYI